MRITDKQRQVIVSVLQPYGQVFLFGSRADNHLKGGDIDLLLLVPINNLANIKNKKFTLLAQIEKQIGEQKLDLTIATAESLNTDPFLKHISSHKIALT